MEDRTKAAALVRRRLFFERLAFRNWDAMRLLLRGGRLWKRDGWREVLRHCLVQVAVMDALTELLGMTEADRKSLCCVASVHDWDKRWELSPESISETYRILARQLLDRIAPIQALMEATKPEFLVKALVDAKATWLECLQFYVDDLCMGSNVVTWRERIEEQETRKPYLNQDAALTKKLGGPYWQKERELCAKIEQELFEKLRARGVSITAPTAIPRLLRAIVEEKASQQTG